MRILTRRRLNGPDHPERGISLIEITVVLLIIGMIVPVVYGLLSGVQKDEVVVSSRSAAAGQARIIDEALSRQIHAAAIPNGLTGAIVSAMPNSLEFYSSLSSIGNSNGPTELNISTAKTCPTCSTYNLVEQVIKPGVGPNYTTAGGATTTTRVLGTGIVPPSMAAVGTDCSTTTPGIFQYYTNTNSCLQVPSTGLTGSQTGPIDDITVTITTIDVLRPAASPQTTFTLHMTLPNVDIYDQTTTTT